MCWNFQLTEIIPSTHPSDHILNDAIYRSGLIQARLTGAREAQGDVLIFLDAHCECAHGWLQPLLYRVKESREAVAIPLIDVISAKTLEYQTDGYGFDVTHTLTKSCSLEYELISDFFFYRLAASRGTDTSTGMTCQSASENANARTAKMRWRSVQPIRQRWPAGYLPYRVTTSGKSARTMNRWTAGAERTSRWYLFSVQSRDTRLTFLIF